MIYKLILNRRKFEYTIRDGLYEYLRCLCFRSKMRSLKDKVKQSKNTNKKKGREARQMYFSYGKARLKKDLDISGLL